MVTGRDGKHLLVRNIDEGVPARIPRAELDEWKVVWECRPGLENLTPWTPELLTRTDGDGAKV